MTIRLGLILWMLPVALVSGEVAVASPSQDEAYVLQQVNLLRTDFRRQEKVVLGAVREKRIAASRYFEPFWSKVTSNQKANPCRLVYSPALMTAARSMLASGQTAPEKSIFDAKTGVREAGYAGAEKSAVAFFAKDAPDLAAAFAAAVTNVIGEDARKPTYVLQLYAANIICASTWRELGIAVSSTKGRYSLVLVLGEGGPTRPIGGVVYTDANGNRQFDPGEGRPGVPVSAGGARTTSGPGGAWALEVERASAGTVTIGGEDLQLVRQLGKDAVTAQFDWRMPTQAELKRLDALIAEAVKSQANPDAEKRVAPLAALLVDSRMLDLDETRANRIAQLVGPVVDRFEGLRSQVLLVLGEEPTVATKEIETQRKRWNGALPAWFKEAGKLVTLRQQVNAARTAPPGQGSKLAKPLLAQLEKIMDTTIDQAFMELYLSWHADLEALDAKPAAEAPAEPGKKK